MSLATRLEKLRADIRELTPADEFVARLLADVDAVEEAAVECEEFEEPEEVAERNARAAARDEVERLEAWRPARNEIEQRERDAQRGMERMMRAMESEMYASGAFGGKGITGLSALFPKAKP